MTGVAPLFGALAVGVAGADTIPYVRDILAGTTRPHRGTWFAFAILAIVVTLSQRSGARLMVRPPSQLALKMPSLNRFGPKSGLLLRGFGVTRRLLVGGGKLALRGARGKVWSCN